MVSARPIRVLHILKHMEGGGIEAWLHNVARFRDPARLQMDILVRWDEPSEASKRFEDEGVRVFNCPYTGGPAAFAKRFLNVIQEHGPYDVVHCHSLFNWGYALRLSKRAGVPVRIGHAHNGRHWNPGTIRSLRVAFRVWLFRNWWTGGLGCSERAAAEIFGTRWRRDPRFRILYCGVDMAPFTMLPDPVLRDKLGVPRDAWVIGHVGRFSLQKNHPLIIQAAAHAMRADPSIWTVLVGSGEDLPRIRAMANATDVSNRFVFAGYRNDVATLMSSVFDAFFLPSLWEGLGLVLMEAQSAGLPVLTSDGVTAEGDVVPGFVQRLALSEPADRWGNALLRMKRNAVPISREEALQIMLRSPFNIRNSVEALQRYYEECMPQALRAQPDSRLLH